jgi:hypothetical protein
MGLNILKPIFQALKWVLCPQKGRESSIYWGEIILKMAHVGWKKNIWSFYVDFKNVNLPL